MHPLRPHSGITYYCRSQQGPPALTWKSQGQDEDDDGWEQDDEGDHAAGREKHMWTNIHSGVTFKCNDTVIRATQHNVNVFGLSLFLK